LAFYRICPDCGAYLDPGEQCSCHEEHMLKQEKREKAIIFIEKMMKEEKMVSSDWQYRRRKCRQQKILRNTIRPQSES